MTFAEFTHRAIALAPADVSVYVDVRCVRHRHHGEPREPKLEFSVSTVNDQHECIIYLGNTPEEALAKLELARNPPGETSLEAVGEIASITSA